jgi:hypothetical protein
MKHTAQAPGAQAADNDGTFALWQPTYAEHGIATFPLRPDKAPAIRGFNKVGLRGSEQLAFKFAKADALAFMCGTSNKVTVGDIDTTDERVLADFLTRHGATPVVIRTASGKFHAWYRHNGERRRIRPWPERPIDILGRGGFVVAPPSRIGRRRYRFVQGSLDDLDRLPVLRGLESDLYVAPASRQRQNITNPLRGMREGDGRNRKLFLTIGPVAREIYAAGGIKDALFDVAMSHNKECDQPMAVEEVGKIVNQVWKMTTEHRNWIGRGGDRKMEVCAFAGHVDSYFLLEFLRVSDGASETFWIANGLARKFGWTLKRLVNARNRLIELGYIERIKRASSGSPAKYVWA